MSPPRSKQMAPTATVSLFNSSLLSV